MIKKIGEPIKRGIFKNKLFLWAVIVPFLLFTMYTLLIAKPRYVSNSSVTVQNINGAGELSNMGALLFAGIAGNSQQDVLLIKEYISSADMLNAVDEKFKILNHWNSPQIDILYRLWFYDKKELALEYFRDKVKPILNPETGTLQISVETFDPKLSKEVLDFVLKKSEEFVNNNNHKAADEQLNFIDKEIKNIKEKLDVSRGNLIEYQKTSKFFTPQAEIEQASKKIMILEESKIKSEAEYNAKKTFLHENSPKMITLKETIFQLEAQIKSEKSKLLGTDGKKSSGINDHTDKYKLLEADLELRSEEYKNALITYEKVKIEATRKLKQLILVATPQLPDYPIYPNKKMNILYAFIILIMVYGIFGLLKDIVKEHK